MNDYLNNEQSVSSDIARDFIRSVYTYMFAALSISGIIAYTIGTDEEVFNSLFTTATGVSPLFYVVMFSPIVVVLAMSIGLERLSMRTILVLFILYSVLMGLSLSFIFMMYSMGSIALTFFAASGAFGIMAVLGYTTKTDLTKFGSLLYMALGGIIIASIINMFMHSSGMDKMITYIGVFVFTGFVVYKMQMLKELAHNAELEGEQRNKLALFGGLSLYITFINLFLTLLRLFGSRD